MDPEKLRAQVKHFQLDSKKILEGLYAGNFQSVFKGQGMEFNDVREYVEGDDVRNIDWNVSSRIGSPFTKTFREEREVTIFIVVDFSSSLKTGTGVRTKREDAAILYALLTFAAAENNDKVGSLFFSDTVEKWAYPRKGRNHALKMLQDMLQFEPVGEGSNLARALQTASETMKQRGICIIISDFKASGYFKQLSVLAKRHDVIAIKLSDPEETELPHVGRIPVIDPETGEQAVLDTNNEHARKKYTDYWSIKDFEWKRVCGKRKIRTLSISTYDNPADKLVDFLRRKGKSK